MQLDPATGLAEYPAAFVGTLVSRSGQIGVVFSSDADTVYRFEVEEWVKGDLGDIVDVHSAADGSSCGIEVGIGNRAGVFLSVENGQLHSSLCSTIDADVLLAGAEPLVVGAPGPGLLLVAGNFGGYTYVVLNRSGGIVAGLPNPIKELSEQPWQFAICPGGKTLVEQWSRWLIVRDLSDLTVTRLIDVYDFSDTIVLTAVRCTSEDGSSILLAGEEWTGNSALNRLMSVSDYEFEPALDLPPGQVFLGEKFAVVSDFELGRVNVVDYKSGEINALQSIERPTSDDAHVYISTLAISPDSSVIAVSEVRYDGSRSTSMLVLHTSDGLNSASVDLEGEVYGLQWLDGNRLFVSQSTDDGSENSSTVYAVPTFEVETELDGWQGYNQIFSAEVVFAIDGGSIVSGDLETGDVQQITTLPTQVVGPIAVLPADFKPSPELIGTSPETNTPITVPPLISDQFGGTEPVDVTTTARIVLAVLLFGGIVGFVLTRKKTRNAD